MIGVVIASHCNLAQEMLRTAELIVGSLQACKTLSMDPQQPVEDMVRHLKEAIKAVETRSGGSDSDRPFGGTPANVSLSFMGPGSRSSVG